MERFGSVAWQQDNMMRITKKLFCGEKLSSEERAFAEVQFMHNYHHGIISKAQYLKGLKALKRVI